MLRLLGGVLFIALAAFGGTIEGRWKLVSLDADSRGEEVGTAQFAQSSVQFQFADGTKVNLVYQLADGVLAGQIAGSGKRLITMLRGRFDNQRDSLTMALVIRHLDNASANRSLKLNCIRVGEAPASR